MRDYGVVKSEKVFLKIDTEGAESSILPSLTALIKQFDTKPTVLVSMHATGTDSQRQQMADFLNMYPYYVIFPGRQGEGRVSNRDGMDDGLCEEGVVLFENDGSRFDGGKICDWFNYLVVHDNRASREKCGASVQVECPTLQTTMPLVADAAKHGMYSREHKSIKTLSRVTPFSFNY